MRQARRISDVGAGFPALIDNQYRCVPLTNPLVLDKKLFATKNRPVSPPLFQDPGLKSDRPDT
jgi:hypothetical protein